MDNPLKNLIIDKWYKALLVLGATVFILALTIELRGIANSIALLISLGVILIGEWINHPLQTRILPPGEHYPGWLKGSVYVRRNTLLGLLFDCFGIVLIVVGIIKIV